MIGTNRYSTIGSFKDFSERGNDADMFSPLVKGYMDGVKEEIVEQLKIHKNISDEKANDFLLNMFSTINARGKQIKEEIKNSFAKSISKSDCAKLIIDNYYKITKINNYKDTDNQEEITEVSESNQYHFKEVSKSLFWNFIRIVNDLGIKFEFDTSFIDDKDTSLNKKGYLFYIESDNIDKEDILHEFSISRIFSKVAHIIESSKDLKISLFIGISNIERLRFGYIIDGNRYTIGDVPYTSEDIKKLTPHIKYVSNDISIFELGKRFKTSLYTLSNLKDVFINYLQHYVGVKVFLDVFNNKLTLIVATEGEDILNYNYVQNIIDSNKVYKSNNEFIINKIEKNNISYFEITIK